MSPTKTSWPMIVLALAIALPSSAQAPPGQPKPKPVSPYAEYAGEWASSFDGNVWLRFRLVLQGDALTGSLVHAKSIEWNDNGELKSVSDEQATESVTSAEVNPDGLLLTLKDAETQETDRYLVRLTSPAKDTAEVKVIGMKMPPGMAKPKPWKITKVR
jgi:hypothetical protein